MGGLRLLSALPLLLFLLMPFVELARLERAPPPANDDEPPTELFEDPVEDTLPVRLLLSPNAAPEAEDIDEEFMEPMLDTL